MNELDEKVSDITGLKAMLLLREYDELTDSTDIPVSDAIYAMCEVKVREEMTEILSFWQDETISVSGIALELMERTLSQCVDDGIDVSVTNVDELLHNDKHISNFIEYTFFLTDDNK